MVKAGPQNKDKQHEQDAFHDRISVEGLGLA
jgi:hypothetical protein